MSDYINVNVAVIRISPKADLDPQDADLEGVYVATVAKGLPLSSMASAAIDRFHEAQAVEVLDDFTIVAYDPETGVTLREDLNSEDGQHLDLCPSIEKTSDKRLKLYSIEYDGVFHQVVSTSKVKALKALIKVVTGNRLVIHRRA